MFFPGRSFIGILERHVVFGRIIDWACDHRVQHQNVIRRRGCKRADVGEGKSEGRLTYEQFPGQWCYCRQSAGIDLEGGIPQLEIQIYG